MQVAGVNTFANILNLIVKYLKLPEYTSKVEHFYQRTYATFLVNAGADILSLEQHGGWKDH